MYTSLSKVSKTQSVLSLYHQANNINHNLSSRVYSTSLEVEYLIEDISVVTQKLYELGTNLQKLYVIEQQIGAWMGVKV